MCRWALIARPMDNSQSCYLILGELYNNDIKNNISSMSEFFRDLKYYYPFRFSTKRNYPYNIQDIIYLQKKYCLTVNLRLVGTPEKDIVIFNTPMLYDIDCSASLFLTNVIYDDYKPKNDHVCIIFPYCDPVNRGKLLEEVMEYGPSYFVVIGDSYRNNKDSTACLMRRFLLSRKVASENIIKLRQNNNTESILDAVALVNLFLNKPYDIVIACRNEHIRNIAKTIRIWKKRNILQKRKVYYICL